jgi:RNA polymerase sigma-70 factor (ECF subfamily)
MERTDEELLNAYSSGEETAFEALFHRHKGRVFNFSLRMLADRAEAEDVTSETFIQLFNKRYRDTGQAKLSTWLFTVARNACLTRLRAKKLFQPMWFKRNARLSADDYEEWDIPDTALSPSETLQKKELAKAVRRAVLALPEEQKEAVILREYFEKNYAEIALILDCSLEKVKILIFRGRENLRLELAAVIKEETR